MKYSISQHMSQHIECSVFPQTVKNVNFNNQTFDIILLSKTESSVSPSLSFYHYRVEGGFNNGGVEFQIGFLTVAKLTSIRQGTFNQINTGMERPIFDDIETEYESDFDDL
jgi:hypothetical protein